NTDDLFVGKTLLHGDVLMWLMKTLLTSGCTNQRGAGQGGHLLTAAVARKLFNIHEDGRSKILVRFITEGKQTELRGKATKGGYTVWKMKSGHPTPIYVADLDKAVRECLK
ncbi:hypothetical protein ACLEVP_16860, partial [Escherichia coli]